VILGFSAYYLSIVPGQNLMRYQVWDISWKLGNTAGNGGVMSGGTFVFRPHLSSPRTFVADQSYLTGNFTYV
jgi:hypothetical protein